MRVVIVDDDYPCIEILENFCQRYTSDIEIVGTAESVDEAIEVCIKTKPDLIFLDIEINDQSGFEVIEALNRSDLMVIITSAHEKYAMQAIKSKVIDFLLKPISIPGFIHGIEDAKNIHQRNRKILNGVTDLEPMPRFVAINIPGKEVMQLIAMEDILHLEGSGNYSEIITFNGDSFTSSKPLSYYEIKLPSEIFYRVHKSHIVNIKGVVQYARIRYGVLSLVNGAEIPISETKRSEILKLVMI